MFFARNIKFIFNLDEPVWGLNFCPSVISMRFRAFRVDWDTLIFFENFRELRATREARNGPKGVKIFFCIFTRFRAFWVDWDTLFFSKIFREREERNARERSERDASAKPEGAKRSSSPAGLAGRSAERACKLVFRKLARIQNTNISFASELASSLSN